MKRWELLLQNAEKHRQLICDVHDYIWEHAESGFREWKTSAYLENAFEKLGYTLTRAGNIPVFYTDIDIGRPGPKVLILGRSGQPDDRQGRCGYESGRNCSAAVRMRIPTENEGQGFHDLGPRSSPTAANLQDFICGAFGTGAFPESFGNLVCILCIGDVCKYGVDGIQNRGGV